MRLLWGRPAELIPPEAVRAVAATTALCHFVATMVMVICLIAGLVACRYADIDIPFVRSYPAKETLFLLFMLLCSRAVEIKSGYCCCCCCPCCCCWFLLLCDVCRRLYLRVIAAEEFSTSQAKRPLRLLFSYDDLFQEEQTEGGRRKIK